MSKGNTFEDLRSAQAKYAATDKGRAARARYMATERGKAAQKRANRKQDERRREQRHQVRLLQAERGRVRSLIRSGILESMSASEKEQWLRRCGDENPVLLQALHDEGVI